MYRSAIVNEVGDVMFGVMIYDLNKLSVFYIGIQNGVLYV